jgi:hypothetical protein
VTETRETRPSGFYDGAGPPTSLLHEGDPASDRRALNLRANPKTSGVAWTRAAPFGALRSRLALVLVFALGGCEPQIDVGEWVCTPEGRAARPSTKTDPIEVPWSTSFEDGICAYERLSGFCYTDPDATYEIVETHAHSGKSAIAFTVDSATSGAHQARCVRQGVLPSAAYYGAWYYVPELATNDALWNLFHFQGGDSSAQHGLWDISLINETNGELQVVVFDFLNGVVRQAANPTPIPTKRWFHLELYLKRAADATGEVALYQDGEMQFDAKNIITDDSSFGQWYVGNLADGLTPPISTVYVDDVSITAQR